MNIEPKLQKLLHLRQLRERISSSALSQAKADCRKCQDDLDSSEATFSNLQRRRFAETQVALKRAESVRDSTARFAGIAITLQKQSVRIEKALDQIDICEERLEDAKERTTAQRSQYVGRAQDTQKTEMLLKNQKAARLAGEAEAEDAETAEFFAARMGPKG